MKRYFLPIRKAKPAQAPLPPPEEEGNPQAQGLSEPMEEPDDDLDIPESDFSGGDADDNSVELLVGPRGLDWPGPSHALFGNTALALSYIHGCSQRKDISGKLLSLQAGKLLACFSLEPWSFAPLSGRSTMVEGAEEQQQRVVRPHITSVEFDTAGCLFAVGSTDGFLNVYDFDVALARSVSFRRRPRQSPYSVTMSELVLRDELTSDSGPLSEPDRTMCRMDEPVARLQTKSQAVDCVAWDMCNSNMLASASARRGTVNLYNLEHCGNSPSIILNAGSSRKNDHKCGVVDLAFKDSSQGLLCGGCQNGSVVLWDCRTNSSKGAAWSKNPSFHHREPPNAARAAVRSVMISSCGNILYAAKENASLQVWDIRFSPSQVRTVSLKPPQLTSGVGSNKSKSFSLGLSSASLLPSEPGWVVYQLKSDSSLCALNVPALCGSWHGLDKQSAYSDVFTPSISYNTVQASFFCHRKFDLVNARFLNKRTHVNPVVCYGSLSCSVGFVELTTLPELRPPSSEPRRGLEKTPWSGNSELSALGGWQPKAEIPLNGGSVMAVASHPFLDYFVLGDSNNQINVISPARSNNPA